MKKMLATAACIVCKIHEFLVKMVPTYMTEREVRVRGYFESSTFMVFIHMSHNKITLK